MIELKKVNKDNIGALLTLKVKEEQQGFVADNTTSIIEAYCQKEEGYLVQPFGIYADDTPVGFLMVSFNSVLWEDHPMVAVNNYDLTRIMIDERYQHLGYGREALRLVIEWVKSFPFGKADYLWLAYEKENTTARQWYLHHGFVENGQFDGDEIVAVLPLS